MMEQNKILVQKYNSQLYYLINKKINILGIVNAFYLSNQFIPRSKDHIPKIKPRVDGKLISDTCFFHIPSANNGVKIYIESGIYICHGCGEELNSISLVSRLFDITMDQALETLAAFTGDFDLNALNEEQRKIFDILVTHYESHYELLDELEENERRHNKLIKQRASSLERLAYKELKNIEFKEQLDINYINKVLSTDYKEKEYQRKPGYKKDENTKFTYANWDSKHFDTYDLFTKEFITEVVSKVDIIKLANAIYGSDVEVRQLSYFATEYSKCVLHDESISQYFVTANSKDNLYHCNICDATLNSFELLNKKIQLSQFDISTNEREHTLNIFLMLCVILGIVDINVLDKRYQEIYIKLEIDRYFNNSIDTKLMEKIIELCLLNMCYSGEVDIDNITRVYKVTIEDVKNIVKEYNYYYRPNIIFKTKERELENINHGQEEYYEYLLRKPKIKIIDEEDMPF